MPHMTEHITALMKRLNFPAEAAEAFNALCTRLDNNDAFAEKFDKIVYDYMYPVATDIDDAVKKLGALAAEYGENEYTLCEMFLLSNTEELLRRYKEKGIAEDIYWDTMDDLRCKLLECIECEEVPGTFVAGWDGGFFKLERFAYGRFQYEVTDYGSNETFTTKCGITLKKGDTLINFHIPSSGVPLTDEVRLDSLKRAYPHFKDLFGGGPVIFCCGSWLLYPKHREFLPASSNILRFMDDFELISWAETEKFSNGWRVYGKDSDLPLEDLPEKTSLQRAYKKWLCDGNKAGNGYGIIVFDGEKILR